MEPVACPSVAADGLAAGSAAVLPRQSDGVDIGGGLRPPPRRAPPPGGRAGGARVAGLSVRAGRDAALPAGLPTAAMDETRLTTCTFGRSQMPERAAPTSAAMKTTWPSTEKTSALTGRGAGAGAAAARQRVA